MCALIAWVEFPSAFQIGSNPIRKKIKNDSSKYLIDSHRVTKTFKKVLARMRFLADIIVGELESEGVNDYEKKKR